MQDKVREQNFKKGWSGLKAQKSSVAMEDAATAGSQANGA